MLTAKDIQKLKEAFREDFVTREEFSDFRDEMEEFRQKMRNDMLQFKDDILWEIKGIREEIAISIGYRGTLEDHEHRIEMLEEYRRLAQIPHLVKA